MNDVTTPADLDPVETREWLASIDSVLRTEGPQRAHYLLERLIDHTRRSGAYLPFRPNTAYVNTIAVTAQPEYPGDRALEVGAGCGYQAAVLAELCAEVFAIEIVPALAERARRVLAESEIRNVTLEAFDGSGGWPGHAPYDVIIVSAGAPRIPTMLVGELADGGRLVIPVGGPQEQELAVVRRVGDDYQTTFETRCRYVDLRGRFGVGGGAPAA